MAGLERRKKPKSLCFWRVLLVLLGADPLEDIRNLRATELVMTQGSGLLISNNATRMAPFYGLASVLS